MKCIIATIAILALTNQPQMVFAGNLVNGGSNQIGPVTGGSSGNDTVTASGTFAGSYSQNPANAGGTETVSIDSSANITVPYGIYNRTATQQRKITVNNVTTTYTDTYNYNALYQINQGSMDNQGILNATFKNRPGSSLLFGLDPYVDGVNGVTPNPPQNQNYTTIDGILAWCSLENQYGPTTITNGSLTNSSAAIKAILTGQGEGFANGIQSREYYASSSSPVFTLQNYGTIDGEVINHDGTASGVNAYSVYGGLNVTNYAGATCSATAQYYATGIYGNITYGDINVVNRGTATATATGGRQGATINTAFATGVDLFTYGANLSFTNNGTVTSQTSGTPNGSPNGDATNVAYGVFLWSEDDSSPTHGGAMTFTNSGAITATSSNDPNAGAKAVYCGGNGGPQTVNNYGSITSNAGPKGGWALGVESDQYYPINVYNTGTMSCLNNNGLGLGVFINKGKTVIRNLGSISGALRGISADTCPGPMTVYNHGTLYGNGDGSMVLGTGSNTAYFYGLPAVTGSINGGGQPTGGGSVKKLNFHLTGVLQTVNGAPANNGASLSAYSLGNSGNIVVSGQTYSWNNFTVAGSTAASIANGTYKIINRLSAKALGARGSGTGNGTIVEQYPYTGGTPQQWTLTSLGNGRFKVINVNSGRALEVPGGATADNSTIDLYDYVVGATNEQWILVPTDSGYFTLTPANALRSCLDVAGASLVDFAPMNLWTHRDADAPSGGKDQEWILQAP